MLVLQTTKKNLNEFEKKKDLIHLIHILTVGKFMKMLMILRSTRYLKTTLKNIFFFFFRKNGKYFTERNSTKIYKK